MTASSRAAVERQEPRRSERRVLLVTGGSRGIGAAIAERAARAGYAVCLTYASNRDAADRIVERLQPHGQPTLAVQADVGVVDDIARAFRTAEEQLGPVTALVNNAGVTGRIGPFVDTSITDMRRILDINVLGTLVSCQHAVRRWQQQQSAGSVVNISSVAATLGAPDEYVAYAASKAAVETLTVGLAKEVAAQGIRINAVSPGTVYTDIHAAAGEPDRPARVVQRVPMGRIGQPDEISNAVLWLLSEEASYVTGAILRVSGGV